MKHGRRRQGSLSQQGSQAREQAPRRRPRDRRRVWFTMAAFAAATGALFYWQLSRPAPNRAKQVSDLLAAVPPSDRPAPSADSPGPHVDAPLPTTVAGLMQEAEQVAECLVERFPDDVFALDCVAKTQLYLGNTTQASHYWQRCLQSDPRAAFAHEGLGRIAVQKSNYEEAASHFRKAVELSPVLADKTWRSDTAYQLADTLMKLGCSDEAIGVLEESTRSDPEAAKSHLLLGQLLLQRRDYAQAKTSFEAVLRLQPTSSHAHFGLASVFRRTGEREKAARYMKTFEELRAQRSEVRTGMRFQSEEPKELAAKVAMTYIHCGQINEKHGDFPEAERHWRRAAKLSEGNAASRVSLAALYAKTSRPAKALETYKELAAIDPTNPLYLWQYGMLCVRMGDRGAAQTAFQTVLELAPERAEAYAALAALYLQPGQNPAEAKRLAEEAVRLESTGAHYTLLSQACAQCGDSDGALRAARKAMEQERSGTAAIRTNGPQK